MGKKKTEIKVVVDIISQDRKMNVLMRAFDVFEEAKKFGTPWAMEIKYKPGSKPNYKKLLKNTQKAIEKMDHLVFFIGFRNVKDAPCFVATGINQISNGKTFMLFKDLLNMMGYEAETDQNMRVTSAHRNIL